MTDGIVLNSGAGGSTVDAEFCATRGFYIQRVKLVTGAIDTDGGNVSASNGLPVAPVNNPVGSAAFVASQVTVGTTYSTIAARTGVSGTGRIAVTIYNGGSAPIYYGQANTVSTTTGAAIPAGGGVTINTQAAVYLISGSAGQTAHVTETF